jgi:hypothetical protein
MLFTKIEDVQKASYNLIEAITVKRIEQLSVSFEMQTIKEAKLNIGLVANLCKSSGTACEVFGRLLTWMTLLNHFENSVSYFSLIFLDF